MLRNASCDGKVQPFLDQVSDNGLDGQAARWRGRELHDDDEDEKNDMKAQNNSSAVLRKVEYLL